MANEVELKHRRWINTSRYLCCPICKEAFCRFDADGDMQNSNYCPNCGEKLDGAMAIDSVPPGEKGEK